MSPSEWLDGLRRIDINDLDTHNMGAWPPAIKVLMGIVVAVLVLSIGYNFSTSELENQLELKREEESTLKEQFASKSQMAANLELYSQQMKEMENAFGVLLRQLPSDTEVPGLLEDITRTGLGSGLEFEEIKLLPEVTQPFYIELPIKITVTGAYHDLATFVSGVAGLPRIVTLHDFDLAPVNPDDGPKLRMSILARTYRYNDKGLN
ncbi:type 4a pilus biogenesis protein PilO [Pseudomonas umsongensis]|jgi:type IV pilus assembly protein PilO|uniref:Pilus assembly protein PilP n=1 Tax=Pseudomonas umsongensis TaxID=198618 RepID=A0AAE6ZS25_9PSED|nr:type 4a pilus biogenesis protein PilO [Pseudomonas umsongensis]KEX93033.1 pilus assembly protein PilP [Pseudomonas putida]MBT9573309.1 type 4a pilus biogenesis protein PilO [Pseudomonas umsongensis]OXR30601.1 pilus assembly protein PilP [Pseudomonas umsongensis]QFG33568.1 type 4a pilus biogenesis protein PilO [Pseudomonas umsongensis]QJC77169.1 type 4a pilus biogenesis protein PilO [Pseudomonas umsongensis]